MVRASEGPITSQHESSDSIVEILWTSKAWRLLAILLVYISGMMLMLPVLPTLVTNDFASRRAGKAITCEDFPPKDAPAACQDAHSDVVFWSTWSGFFQNTLFSVMLTPAMGAWSDLHGRKPFLLIAQGLACLPYCIVLLNLHAGLPLTWLYVIQAFTGSISTIAPSLAYIADSVPPALRAPCFGLILASFSVAVLIGPPLGALLAPKTAPLATITVILLCMLCTWLLLPESLSSQAASEAKERQAHASGGGPVQLGPAAAIASTWRAMAILRRSPLFIRLTIVLMMGAVVSEGLQDILIQYLQIKLNFVAPDVGHLFMVYGGCALLVQGFLLRIMLRAVGERRLLVVGLVAGMGQQIALALAGHKWQVLAAVSLGSLGSVTFPTISSIKANAASEHEQGSVQGALYGAKALASGVGPLAFAALFAAFTRSDSPLPFFPGAPFVLGAVLMAAVSWLAAGLPAEDAGNGELVERVYVSGPGGLVPRDEEESFEHWDDDPEGAKSERKELLRKNHLVFDSN